MYQDRLKPTHKPIKGYYAALAAVQKTGAKHEMALRTAFQELLTAVARQRGWTFVPERAVVSEGHRVVPDGTLLDEHHIPRGHWEAKDLADNLDAEIARKKAKGYPLYNIIFENGAHAALYQNGIEVSRKNLTDPEQLCQLLNVHLEYARPVVQSFEQAVAKFKEDVPELAAALQKKLAGAHKDNAAFKKAFADFFELCRTSLNPNISQPAVDEMLVQHLLTERLFRTVFNRQDFTRRNVIANEVEKVIDALHRDFDRTKFMKSLDYFYKAIEGAALVLEDFGEKQQFMNTVYERFFQGYSVKTADTHGIVYTPQEIVDFMCASVAEVLEKEFNTTLGGKDVWILDPCTGTGNFIVNLIKRMPLGQLKDAYANRLFANEIMLLPYYIAALNIEHAYAERMGDYEPFEGLCFVDTLELAESKQRGMAFMTKENAKRVQRQQKAPITVIIGNPPYNMGQSDEGENNQNREYKVVEDRLRETYVKDSTATLRNKLYDPYVKFFRWASDRLQGRDGLVCLVSNNSFLEQRAFDGMRKHLARDFTSIVHLNLRGKVRDNPELSGTAFNVFGIQVGVGITLCVKRASAKSRSIQYAEADLNWRREKKLAWLRKIASAAHLTTQILTPDAEGNWLTIENAAEFDRFASIGSKTAKAGAVGEPTLFRAYSLGLVTSRDTHAYSFQRGQLGQQAEAFVEVYNSAVDRLKRLGSATELSSLVDVADARIKWTRQVKASLKKLEYSTFNMRHVREAQYRPFARQLVYSDDFWNEERYLQPRFFPTAISEKQNVAIAVSDIVYRSPNYGVLAVNRLSDLHLCASVDAHQCFPFYVYDEDGTNRRENITDWALKTFRAAYGDKTISKWDIFHYVYGILHHPGYREKFKDCLKRELPRIPFAGFSSAGFQPAPAAGIVPAAPSAGAQSGDDTSNKAERSSRRRAVAGTATAGAAGTAALQFRAFADAGEKLCKLHLDYENAQPWPLEEIVAKGAKGRDLYVIKDKMRLSKDKASLRVNDWLTLQGIPQRCFDYRLGNRSALEWVIDQYRIHEDKRSGIRSDPNRADDPEYIVRLVKQVVRVSMETLDIIDGLPESYGGPMPDRQ